MDFISKSNLIKAGIVGAAAMLALRMTASRGKLVQGLATVAIVAVALPLSNKVS